MHRLLNTRKGAACVAPTLSRREYESLSGERCGPCVRYVVMGKDGPKQVIRPCNNWEDWAADHAEFLETIDGIYKDLPPMFGMVY